MKELSIIIPAYNEAECIGNTLGEILSRVDEKNTDLEIVVVDDGSTDNTSDLVKNLMESEPRIRLTGHNHNRGFGEAVKTGIKQAHKENLLLVPADGQFDPEEIQYFQEALEKYDLVIGVRGERRGYTLFRQLVSLVYINMVNLLFQQNYRDTNWVQAWKKKLFDVVQPVSRGVFFLQETITRSDRAGYSIGQVNSAHRPRLSGKEKGSRLDFILFTLYEMLKFWWWTLGF